MKFNVKTLGDGWASRNASDLMKIAVTFGGYDPVELIKRINARQRGRYAKISEPTVCAVLDEMLNEARPELAAEREIALAKLYEEMETTDAS